MNGPVADNQAGTHRQHGEQRDPSVDRGSSRGALGAGLKIWLFHVFAARAHCKCPRLAAQDLSPDLI